MAGQYPRAITHDETVAYSYDPDTDTFRAVVDADRPRVTRTDDSPPDGDARPVGGWHIKPTAQGVEAAERDINPQVPDDVAEELRARAEQEGGPVSMTTRRSFEHDLDTRETERVRAGDDRAERIVKAQRATPPTPGADARRLAAQMAKKQAAAGDVRHRQQGAMMRTTTDRTCLDCPRGIEDRPPQASRCVACSAARGKALRQARGRARWASPEGRAQQRAYYRTAEVEPAGERDTRRPSGERSTRRRCVGTTGGARPDSSSRRLPSGPQGEPIL